MRRLIHGVLLILVLCGINIHPATAETAQTPAAFVRSMLEAPASEMSFARAKLAVDRFAYPSIDDTAALAELDGMVATIHKMLGTLPPEQAATDMEKMKALRAKGGY